MRIEAAIDHTNERCVGIQGIELRQVVEPQLERVGGL
jgi:hypothetical protein